jgi:hypothetical protein
MIENLPSRHNGLVPPPVLEGGGEGEYIGGRKKRGKKRRGKKDKRTITWLEHGHWPNALHRNSAKL